MSKKRLGRGLDALLSERSTAPQSEPADPAATTQKDPSSASDEAADNRGERAAGANAGRSHGQAELLVTDIQPSPYQPRRHFAPEALQELADSIASRGLLQPVVVRERPQGGYELIAGERRWRAAQQAGLKTIPALIKTVSDEEASALALIENMQREDLNAMEEAMGLARLRDEFSLTQQQIADAVGKSRAAIANLLRLMNLGSITRGMLESGALEMGHARALLGLDGIVQDQTAQKVAEQNLSVRQTETLVRKLLTGGNEAKKKASRPSKDPDTVRLEQRIADTIGAPVTIKHSPQGKGELTIRYSTLDELDGVLRHLGVDE